MVVSRRGSLYWWAPKGSILSNHYLALGNGIIVGEFWAIGWKEEGHLVPGILSHHFYSPINFSLNISGFLKAGIVGPRRVLSFLNIKEFKGNPKFFLPNFWSDFN